jgi:hypothetical protein
MVDYTLKEIREVVKAPSVIKNAIQASKLVLDKVAQVHGGLFEIKKSEYMANGAACSQLKRFAEVFASYNDIRQEQDATKQAIKITNAQKYGYCVNHSDFVAEVTKATRDVLLSKSYLIGQFKYAINNNLKAQLSEYCNKHSSDPCYDTTGLIDTNNIVYCGSDFIDYTLGLLT